MALKGHSVEVILVDDGSTDDSWHVICTLRAAVTSKNQVRGIKLSRNFGQHAAIYAGLKEAKGRFIFVLDADLQDDPVYMPEMLGIATKTPKVDVVHTLRTSRKKAVRVLVSQIVYRILTWASEIPLHPAMGNYKLISRPTLDAALKFAEPAPLFELMVAKAGFQATHINVKRRARPVNTSAYKFRDSLRFINGLLVSYSALFFRLSIFAGTLLVAGGTISMGVTSQLKPLLLGATALVTGVVLVGVGVLGYYIRAAQSSARNWPCYVIEENI